MMIDDEIRRCEEELGSSTVRASADALDRLVSDQFVEFGSSGEKFTKRDVIDQMIAHAHVTISLIDFRVLAVSPDVALATYRTAGSLRSSIWRREGPYWRIVFHQGTPIADAKKA
jgi:hypothetical protein